MWLWVGWVLWAFTAYMGLSFAWGCRTSANTQRGFHPGTAVMGFYFCTIALIFLLLPFQRLHLAWAIPLGYLIGPLATFRVIPIISPLLLAVSGVFTKIILIGRTSWMTMLPNHLRPNAFGAIETVRKNYGLGHRELMMHIAGHPLTTRNLQRANFAQLIALRPDLPREMVIRELVRTRRLAAWRSGHEFFGLLPGAPEAEVLQKEARLAAQHPTPDELAAALTKEDSRWEVPSSLGLLQAEKEIASVLERDNVVLI